MTEPRRGHYDRSLVMWITERERQTDRQTDRQTELLFCQCMAPGTFWPVSVMVRPHTLSRWLLTQQLSSTTTDQQSTMRLWRDILLRKLQTDVWWAVQTLFFIIFFLLISITFRDTKAPRAEQPKVIQPSRWQKIPRTWELRACGHRAHYLKRALFRTWNNSAKFEINFRAVHRRSIFWLRNSSSLSTAVKRV